MNKLYLVSYWAYEDVEYVGLYTSLDKARAQANKVNKINNPTSEWGVGRCSIQEIEPDTDAKTWKDI